LMTSYFYRNTATIDVLMQMGRWFGYRDGYADLCRIWVTRVSYSYYRYIYDSTNALKIDIKTMGFEKRKPSDFGIRVRNDSIELGITAPNKMRNAEHKIVRKLFFGSVFETPYISKNLDIVESNIEKTLSFLKCIKLDQRDSNVTKYPYFRNVSFDIITHLIDSLEIPNENETYFDKKQLQNFMGKAKNELRYFDVLVIGGKQKKRFKFESLNIDIPLVGRCFDIRDNTVRMSKNRLRLGGRADTKNGLQNDEIPLTNSKAQDFMIEGRNPLLIIYFIWPSKEDDNDEEIFTSQNDFKDEINELKFQQELECRKYPFLVGYGLGFPKKQGVYTESIIYTVNKTVSYFDMEHNEDTEE